MSDNLPNSITELFKPETLVAPNSGVNIVDATCINFDATGKNTALWDFLTKQRTVKVIIGTANIEEITDKLEKAPIPETIKHDIQHWDTIDIPWVQTIIADRNPELDGFIIPDHYAIIPKKAAEEDNIETYLASNVTTRNEQRAEEPYLNLEVADDIWEELKQNKSLTSLVGSFKRATDTSNADVIAARYQLAMHALYQYFISYGNNRITKQSDSLLTVSAAQATFKRISEQMAVLDDYSTTPDGLPHMSTKQLLSFARAFVKKEVNALTKPYEPPTRR